MFSHGYSVRIVGGREVSNGSGYVKIGDQDRYSISLRNTHDTRCDAQVTIDGECVGTWRIPANSSIHIERPADTAQLFMFLKRESSLGIKGELDRISKEKLGLISVTFTPEYLTPMVTVQKVYRESSSRLCDDVRWEYYADTSPSFNNCEKAVTTQEVTSTSPLDNVSAGGTVLTGCSHQTFTYADDILLDHDSAVVINLRLVVDNDERGVQVTPLRKRHSTPIPPPIR